MEVTTLLANICMFNLSLDLLVVWLVGWFVGRWVGRFDWPVVGWFFGHYFLLVQLLTCKL